jgi:hypothetical protein
MLEQQSTSSSILRHYVSKIFTQPTINALKVKVEKAQKINGVILFPKRIFRNCTPKYIVLLEIMR